VDANNASTGFGNLAQNARFPQRPTSILFLFWKEKNEDQNHLSQLSIKSDHPHIRMGDVAGARQLLTSVAKVGGDAREATRAARLLRTLDERERLAADRRAAAASQGSARETATVGVALDDPVASARETLDLTRVAFQLRKVQTGEQRVFGVLVTIECGAAGVRFRVRANGQDVAAAAKRIEDVDLIAYGNTQNSTISCGARVPPDVVYFTWTPSAAGGEGDAVAVEFMPKGYVP